MGAKFGLEAFPERPYLPSGFTGHESKKRHADDLNTSRSKSRRSKSPNGMDSSLEKISVKGK